MIKGNPRLSFLSACFFLFLFPISILSAQDTLTVMSYNLLNYGNPQSGCTISTSTKNTQLSVIIPRIMPDIFGVCEIGANQLHGDNIMVNVLTPISSDYARLPYVAPSNSSDLMNMLFYNQAKLTLHDHQRISPGNFIRDHDVWTMYYNSPDLAQGDTTWICVIMSHLKAGDTSTDETNRANATQAIMNFLAAQPRKMNCIVMGDFNVNSSTDAAFANLMTTSNRFYDPINRLGTWGNNSSFADIHTQSTRTTTESDCGSGGGSDDRFDFILANDYLMYDSAGAKILPSTYKAYGQDGDYNAAVNNGSNGTVPANVANALYTCSDHYPVVVDLALSATNVTSRQDLVTLQGLRLDINGNPFSESLKGTLHRSQNTNSNLKIQVIDLLGAVRFEQEIPAGTTQFSFNISTQTWASGLYSLIVSGKDGKPLVKKLTKK